MFNFKKKYACQVEKMEQDINLSISTDNLVTRRTAVEPQS